ncbi:potassium uptake protein KtrA [Spiroplasma sabaudiense Ar-1343]|uniref:Potassium uptake protein KtrA n=1 Tax=Spiroplasma sabaudiense Ar-1343 TaxID=1276257 RepID=W6A8N0_9MOLU|nr:TrkA family potassium uptake protein [Spiroplasma sabaudiense]AHI53523.1 potassium uptake protein KtrA [Spiroplasma sabaudiense Ar-1343]
MARKKSFAVIGANNFGMAVTKTLEDKKQSVVVYDFDEHKLNAHLAGMATAEGIVLDATNKTSLEKAGIKQFDGVIVAFGSNMEVSIITVLNLLDLGIGNIIAKANDLRHKRILLALGLDENQVIIPDIISGKMVATRSLFDIDIDVQSIDDDFISTTIIVSDPGVIDKSIQESHLTANNNWNIIQIKRGGKVILPDEKTILKKDDQVVLFARITAVNDLILKIKGDDEVEN